MYMVSLQGRPPATAFREARARGMARTGAAEVARSRLLAVRRAQDELVSALRDRARVIFRVESVANGLGVLADEADVRRLEELPGVASVVRMTPLAREASSSPATERGAAALRAVAGGDTGAGTTIGIVDTGIDYVHRDLGGDGLDSSYAVAKDPRSNVEFPAGTRPAPAVVTNGDRQIFPSAKVSGVDFVGDDYNAGIGSFEFPPSLETHPDGNPMDCDKPGVPPYWAASAGGHGTHVAGIAAGLGLDANGNNPTSYDGLDPASMSMAPGVAPGAKVVGLRVFGCYGPTYLLPVAVDYAVDPNGDGVPADHLDVLNLSLGSPQGNPEDPSLAILHEAAAAGVSLAISAGNEGNHTAMVGSPGVLPEAVTAAAAAHWPVPADFSSRGPTIDFHAKPDVAAPGLDIPSADADSATGAKTMSGTSMAAPFVAGALALLRSAHPQEAPVDLKTRLMDTALPFPALAAPRAGAGLVDAKRALATDVLARSTAGDGSVSVSFGNVEVAGQTTAERRVVVFNRTTRAQQLAVGYDPALAVPGVGFSFPDGPVVAVPPGGSTEFRIRLDASAAAIRHVHDPSLAETGGTGPLSWLTEASGSIRLTPADGGTALGVPVYASVKPVGEVHAVEQRLKPAGASDSRLALRLTGDAPSAAGDDAFERVAVPLELTYSSPRQETGSPMESSGDLRYSGVGSDVEPAGSVGASTLTFGIVNWGSQLLPAYPETEMRVALDVDDDPEFEFLIRGGTTAYDQFRTLLVGYDGGTNSQVGSIDGAERPSRRGALATNMLTLSIPASALGLDDHHSRFHYRVETYNPFTGTLERTPILAYDPAHPGLSFPSGQFIPDEPGREIPVRYDRDGMRDAGGTGVLLMHLLGSDASRAEVIPVLEETAPTSVAGGPYKIEEGQPLTLDGSASDDANGDSLTYAWDLDGDARADAHGERPTLSVSELRALGLADGYRYATVTLTVSDGVSDVPSTARLEVTDVPPTLDLVMPPRATAGVPVTIGLRVTDPGDQEADFTYVLDYDGDGPGAWPAFDGPDVVQQTHEFPSPGTFLVRALAVDKDGWANPWIERQIVVDPRPTPPEPTQTPTPLATSSPSLGVTQSPTPLPTPKPRVPPSVHPVCIVPRLIGMRLSKARAALVRSGCAVGKIRRPSGAAKFIVTRQSRRAGTSVPLGTRVRLRAARR